MLNLSNEKLEENPRETFSKTIKKKNLYIVNCK